jgi:hypothetical protein
VDAGIAVVFADEIKTEMVRWEKAKPEVLALPQELVRGTGSCR